MSLAESIAQFIQTQEGFYPGSRAYRNNNPGNIWDALIPGVKSKRIWPQYPIDDGGFLVLPDYATGYALMLGQINIKMGRGETLTQLVNEWDSSDSASTRARYLANGVAALGINPDVPLNTLGDSPPLNPLKPSFAQGEGLTVDQSTMPFPNDSGPVDQFGNPVVQESSGINAGYLVGALLIGWALYMAFRD